MIGRARWEGTSGFELSLAPSSEDPGRFTIESIGEISRRSALETLRTFGLVPGLLPVLPDRLLVNEEQDRAGSTAGRIQIVRLSPQRTMRLFDTIRSGDPNVRELYADLAGRGFSLILNRARGTVMRAYSADGLAGGGGLVVELGHERPDGAIAWFHVSTRERISGGSTVPDEARADYTVRIGERVETCTGGGRRARGGRATRAVAVAEAPGQAPGR